MSGVYAAVIGLTALVLLLAVLCVALLRSHAEILRHLDRLGIRLDDTRSGAPLSMTRRSGGPTSGSQISGVTPAGEPLVISPTTGHDPVLLAFLSTTCSSCTVFWEGLDRPQMEIAGSRYRVLLVTLGAEEESPTRAGSLAKGDVEVVMSSQAWTDYQVPGAPYFVLIDPDDGAVVGEGSASTFEALTTFLSDAAGDRHWDAERSFADGTDSDRERMIDEELRRAGIHPGHPSLHPAENEPSEDQ